MRRARASIFDGYPRTAAQAEVARRAARRARPQARPCDRARSRRGRAGRAHHRPLHLRQVRRPAITTRSSSRRSRASATSAAATSSSAGPTTMRKRCARAWPNIAPRPRRSCRLRSEGHRRPRRRHGRHRRTCSTRRSTAILASRDGAGSAIGAIAHRPRRWNGRVADLGGAGLSLRDRSASTSRPLQTRRSTLRRGLTLPRNSP